MTLGMDYFILKAGFDIVFGVFTLPCILYALAFIINVEIPDLARASNTLLEIADIEEHAYTLLKAA